MAICVKNRDELFDNDQVKSLIQTWWDKLPSKFQNIQIDQFVIMPNHIHGIIFIMNEPVGADPCVCPEKGEHTGSPLHKPTLGRIVQWFKTMTTNEYLRIIKQGLIEPIEGKLWQRNYYEHIIRNETDLNNIRQYIIDNPANWEEDENNPKILQEA